MQPCEHRAGSSSNLIWNLPTVFDCEPVEQMTLKTTDTERSQPIHRSQRRDHLTQKRFRFTLKLSDRHWSQGTYFIWLKFFSSVAEIVPSFCSMCSVCVCVCVSVIHLWLMSVYVCVCVSVVLRPEHSKEVFLEQVSKSCVYGFKTHMECVCVHVCVFLSLNVPAWARVVRGALVVFHTSTKPLYQICLLHTSLENKGVQSNPRLC